ncbi:MAG: Sir2 family NAD-dependent protein deacetylase [Planctomycetota bacterium]
MGDTNAVQLKPAVQALQGCRRLLVIAGAGLSADAGVPTFRDAGGLWQTHRVEDLATRAAFERDPGLVWDWYRERREHIATCEPHAGQRSLALLQRSWVPPRRVLVATTNEDDLLDRAGVRGTVHLHGSLFATVCAAGCGWEGADAEDNGLSFLPCPACGAPARPGSVWFNEPLPAEALEEIEAFDPDGCLVVGSSSLVQPVAAIAPELALAGCPVIEINPVPTPLSCVAGCILIQAPARSALPSLVDLLTSSVVRETWSGSR